MSGTSVRISLSGVLNEEHRRLDELWNETRRTLQNSSPPEGQARLKTFEKLLFRHILDEEEILFPRFEQRTGMAPGGPTAVMRMEHRQMEALIDELMTALVQDSGPSQIFERAQAFSALMDAHDKKERGVLYPMMERVFGEEESSALLAKTSIGQRRP